MMLKGIKAWCWAGLLAGMALSAFASPFAAPAEGPVAFRRDKIPLDADTMVGLSKQLEILARGLNAETPADHRGAAQMLALAVALDPANARARDLISDYQKGRHKPGGEVDRLEKSRARIWQYIAWLESPEAGSDAQALAACLSDVIVVSDPKNPKAGAIRSGGEKGAWAGWVPAISAYESPSIASNNGPEPVEPKQQPDSPPQVFLEKAEVSTLLWQMVGNGDSATWALAPAPLRMTAKVVGNDGQDSENDSSFRVVVGPGGEGNNLGHLNNLICNLLKAEHGNLPRNVRVSINSKELEKSLDSKKRLSISAASAVLASSAVTGREPDAIIIGQIDESGAFKLPSAFWDQLQSLGKGSGRRLILPAEAASFLPSLLALEKPGFFMDYEVLLAADFKQLLDLVERTPAGPLANSITEFHKIRERAGTQDVRQYIANTFVKQRLMAVLQETSAHFSAKMLLVQAAGSRPTLVVRPVLAAEIRRALEPMLWLLKDEFELIRATDLARIGPTYEACKTRLDALERYVDKNDRSLLERAREVTAAIRNLDKAARARGEDYFIIEGVAKASSELGRIAKEFKNELAVELGEAK